MGDEMSAPHPNTPTEADLVSAAAAGDRRAFEALYRAHTGRIYAVCLRLCGDAVTAEELTQEAFVRGWRNLGSCRGAFGAWMRRLAINTALNDRRSHARRLARVAPTGSPGALAGRSGGQGAAYDLERAIAGLPSGARHVFVLREIEGLTHAEIAALTGTSEGTSKAQLHRARALLREALS
jgi:RNA polymerase sigma-70 factor (ECF subfamily)